MRPGLPTDLARWRRIEAVLDLALDLPSEGRSALLDQACDPDLRAEVEVLLAADAQASGFLGVPAGESSPELLAEDGEEEAEETATDLAGRLFGPYRLLREIGSGGMGAVYEAEDTRLGRRVAVKLLPPEYSSDRRAKERFLREARTASAVDHPNLCTVHDVGESEGRLYIVLALYEGETLRERIRRGPLPLAEAREVAIQVARGLARAHEVGIVHRDIKAANVMLTRRGEAKILDFGIARLAGEDTSFTRTGTSWGTPAYMSPEQVRGEPVDHRTDLWSLGVLLYEMIAGRRPFRGESPEALATAILTQEPESLGQIRPDVSPGLVRVVERALAKDLAERYATAEDLQADLEKASAAALAFRRWKRGALRKALLTGAAAAALLLAFALWRIWRPPLRVAIQRPVIESTGGNPELAFVASEVGESAGATLISLQGLQPLDPPERDDPSGSEAERLRAAEADEALACRLRCSGNLCQVQFRRLRMPGPMVVATGDAFEVPVGLESSHQLAEGVRSALQRLYQGHKSRRGSSGREVSAGDYATYVEIERRVEAGRLVGGEELDRLDAILRNSTGLVGAYLLAAGIARIGNELDRGLDYAVRAESIAPHDPQPVFARLRIEIQQGRLDEAEATLARLAELVPADIRVKRGKAELLTARGELEEAWKLRQEVAQQRPTWRHVRELASLELSMGRHEAGEGRLQKLLAQHPDNQYLLEDLAELEASSGDLKRAAELYERLIRLQPSVSSLTNLGFVRHLLGDYRAAAEAASRALAVAPDHSQARFNFATALEALGERRRAQELFRTLMQELDAAPSSDPAGRMLHAQCLARLGRRTEALHLADEVLKQRPEDVYILHRAAQVYAFSGEPYQALSYIDLALKKGLRREWFMIPGFRPLQEDPGFRTLLERHQPPAAAR